MNENEKTVYLDCINEPRCLVAARFYKQVKQFRILGNHSEACPPDENVKMKIKFEAFLKKSVIEEKNSAVSVLSLYKQAIKERFQGIWLPGNHRKSFLEVLRRLRTNRKAAHDKPKNSNRMQTKKCDAATSPILIDTANHQDQATALPSPTVIRSKGNDGANENSPKPSTSGSSCDVTTLPILEQRFTQLSVEVQNDPAPSTHDDSMPLIVFSPFVNTNRSEATNEVNIQSK